jgi:nucleoside-diphosphate-sugar epimerase
MDNLLTNWAFPFIVGEGRYTYAHHPDLECSWISLDDVAKFMIAAIDRPDLEGAWLNIGGPEIIKPPRVVEMLSRAMGREIRFDPDTPQQFGRHLADAFGSELDGAQKDELARIIGDFYVFNNTTPLKPFRVNMDPVLERIPIEMETMAHWIERHDWRLTNKPRPPAG